MNNNSARRSGLSRPVRGFSLIEVLVGILIFAAGILGLVGLQASSIRLSGDAKYRANAAYLSSQLISRVWSDRAHIATYAHMPGGTTCTPTGTASSSAEITAWLADVAEELPGASGSVIIATNTITVRLCWSAPNSGQHQHVTIAQVG